MKRQFLALMALVGVLVLGPATAGAVLINFEDMVPGPIEGVHLGTFPDGCTITSADGTTAVALGATLSWGFASYPNVVSNQHNLVGNPMTITFDVPRGYVAFVGGDEGRETDRFVVDGYNANNQLVVHFDTGEFGGNPASPIHYMVDQAAFKYNGPDHLKRVVIEAIGGFGLVIDNLQYCQPAPLPGTLLLLGSGILGLVGLRRKL